jgi:pyruvate/2-oxoglutarate dehydrogenase complex dihydrolipoamide acyltransferase (E2) component
MSDALRVAKEKNYVYGLLEIDVTEARRCIHEYETRTGGDFSFTAFLMGCIALAVDENKAVHALRQGKRLILFDDLDINIQVEHDVGGEKVVSSYIVRAANRKTTRQIHDEIRAAQQQKISADSPVTALPRWVLLATHLPSFVRRLLLRRIMNDPFALRRLGGTINLTAFGMAGKGGGWGIAIAETGLAIMVGGMEQKVKPIDGQICVREMLSITLGFDHDVIDGAPAARFASRMKALIEAAHGLTDL